MNLDWPTLERLRARFLGDELTGSEDYWESESLLEQYDLTFGQRIGWKWRPVLREFQNKATRRSEHLVDWGCGTGIAAREYLAQFGANSISSLLLYDRSEKAVEFAQRRVKEQFPEVPVRVAYEKKVQPIPGATLLISHVASELTAPSRKELLDWIAVASIVIWVEPGTPSSSKQIIGVRERFRNEFAVVAPCPHHARCGLFEKKSRDWCHFFAEPPNEVFQSAFWREFGERLHVDLRALPVTFLILAHRKDGEENLKSSKRVLGRARLSKGMAKVTVCEEEKVEEVRILGRTNLELMKKIKDGGFEIYLV